MKSLVFLFAILAVSQAAVYRYPQEDKPPEFEGNEGCYFSDMNRVVAYDEEYNPIGECRRYICIRGGGPNGADEGQMYTCGVIGSGDNCEIIPGDKTKPYPQCCDGIKCSSHDEDEESEK